MHDNNLHDNNLLQEICLKAKNTLFQEHLFLPGNSLLTKGQTALAYQIQHD